MQSITVRREQLLTGDVRRLTLSIAAPSLCAMLASSLGTLLDGLVLSRAGTQIAAAVGVSYALLTLTQAIGFTLGMGAGSFVSRSLGRGQMHAAQQAASTALCTALLLSGLLCVFGLLFTAPLLHLLGAPPDVLAVGIPYARYVLLCAPILCASLVLSSLLRAQGRTRPNQTAFVLGAALGVGLLLALTTWLPLGVHGAGIAMLAREALTLFLLLRSTLRGKALIRPDPRRASFHPAVYAQIMRSGLPTLLRQGVMSLSAVLLSRVSASLGAASLAGMGLAVRTAALVSSAVIGFGQGFQPVCGVNFGAGAMERCRTAYRFCQCVTLLFTLGCGAAGFFFAKPLLTFFAPEEAAAQFAAAVLRAQSITFFAQGAVILMNMLTQSMGMTLRASLIAVSRQGLFFIPLLLILPRLFGAAGLIVCQSVSDVLSLLFSWLLTRPAVLERAALERT